MNTSEGRRRIYRNDIWQPSDALLTPSLAATDAGADFDRTGSPNQLRLATTDGGSATSAFGLEPVPKGLSGWGARDSKGCSGHLGASDVDPSHSPAA